MANTADTRVIVPTRGTRQSDRRIRGAFINTAEANCSIHESGLMVYGCIKESEAYSLDYFSLDRFDLAYFSSTGKIRTLDGMQSNESGSYDFWVFNWHPHTMAPHLDADRVAKLEGIKFTIVLELAPDDPLKLVPKGLFDGHIALDPTAPATDKIFPFPRPLQGNPRSPAPSLREIPVIGSFGYGTPGKGFELLVEAVNREFERAEIRVNVPRGTHVGTDVVHKTDYAKYIATICKKIAKPGIKVSFTYDFMSADELIDWCSGNDLNCFMYTRCQPGLSATTDQAIISGRPMLTLSNDTFRHIHRYIPPYPQLGLRKAIEITQPAIARIQEDWSRASFSNTFRRMLSSFQLLSSDSNEDPFLYKSEASGFTVAVVSMRAADSIDIINYATRLADCLSRSGTFRVLRAQCPNAADLGKQLEELQPDAVILLDVPLGLGDVMHSALRSVSGPKVILDEYPPTSSRQSGRDTDGTIWLPRRPIIPFYTVYVGLRSQIGIWLIGFSAKDSNLEEIVGKIAAEAPGARLMLEAPNDHLGDFDPRVSRLQKKFLELNISVVALPGLGEEVINCLAADSLVIFYRDPGRDQYLEDISCLAMTTERPVVFTGAAPFPQFLGRETYVEDFYIAELIEAGVAAHIKLLHDFGEWQIATQLSSVLGDGKQKVSAKSAANGFPGTVPTAKSILALRDEAFLHASYRAVLGRPPDTDGRWNYLNLLRSGTPRSTILAALRLSPEGRERNASFPGLKTILFWHAVSRVPLIGTITRLTTMARSAGTSEKKAPIGANAYDILNLRAGTFLDAAYSAVLGRAPDEDGFQNYMSLLSKGVSPWTILAEMRLSPEGQRRGANFPGLNSVVRRHRLLRSSVLGPILRRVGLREDPTDLQRSLRVLENQFHRMRETAKSLHSPPVLETAATPAAEQPTALTAVPEGAQSLLEFLPAPMIDARSVFLLAGFAGSELQPVSTFVSRLDRAWSDHWGILRIVLWDDAAKGVRLAYEEELARLGLLTRARSAVCPQNRSQAVLISNSSCGTEDWLLVPEATSGSQTNSELMELNLILQAKRAGLRTAFVFHGADPLRLEKFAGSVAASHEQYMQALLLADLIIPISTLAMSDLNDFFVQHQNADFIPMIRKVPFPAALGYDDEAQWVRYARSVRGLLSLAGDISLNLTRLYYWADWSSSGGGTALASFAAQLASVLLNRGISLIPVCWDEATKRLISVSLERLGRPQTAVNPQSWSPWTEPDAPNAPSWVLFADGIPLESIDAILRFTGSRGLRIASVLHEAEDHYPVRGVTAGPQARDSLEFEALVQIDKVFAVSDARSQEFEKFLLASRRKVHSAEHRFKTILSPNEIGGHLQRSAVKSSSEAAVQALVQLACDGFADTSALVESIVTASQLSAASLHFTFIPCSCAPGCSMNPGVQSAAAGIPNAVWESGGSADTLELLLDSADFSILLGRGGNRKLRILANLWRGLPSLVHDEGVSSREPGVVVTDMHSADKLTRAILDLSSLEWRQALAEEAIRRPVRLWSTYGSQIAGELASDRVTDSLRAPAKPIRDIYATFINLRKRPKLSLCISTYNRAGWLAVNLHNIFTQISDVRPDLEVLVVDNTSTDNTPEVVKSYQGRADFRYVRNKQNVGMLGNLAVTSQLARGKFIWIIGDDDLTRAGIIDRVLQIIETQPRIALIYFNYGYTSESNPKSVTDLAHFLDNYNQLEPKGPDVSAPVNLLAAKSENFYTAIYSHAYRRDHALRSYCQETSGRIFSTMISCIPTAYYVLSYMHHLPAYWVGEPSLVVNSNVSWADYGALLDLEQLPRAWDLAERTGSVSSDVDQRRANRLWLVAMMWRDIFENDRAGNSAYFCASRVLMRLKHLEEIDKYVAELKNVYEKAHSAGHPAAVLPPEELFCAFAAA